MVLRKSWVVCGLLILFAGVWHVWAETAPTNQLLFQGMQVSTAKWISKDNIKYVNLPFFKQLGVTCVWQPATGQIQLKWGKLTVELKEDQPTYWLDAAPRQLAAGPFEADGQLWLPVQLLKEFGVLPKREEPGLLELGWAEQFLVTVATTTYEGRPALLLTGTQTLDYTSFTLGQPERLVIDLAGVKAHPGLDNQGIQNQLIKQVRFSQFDQETLRIVCDLEKSVGYRIITDPHNDQRLIIVFNYFLQAVELLEQEGEQKLHLRTDHPAAYQVTRLSNPERAVIDLENATLDTSVVSITGNGKWFKRVRMSQFNPQTVRVVVDLADAHSLFKLSRSRKDAKVLELRTVQYVKELDWVEPTASLGQLVITGSDALDATVKRLKDPSRLQVDLDFFQFAAGLQAPVIKDITQIRGIRLVTLSPTAVRVEIDLKFFAGCEMDYAAGDRRLTLAFRQSPLIGRPIMIDAGHGGEDMGATGKQGIREKQVNLDVAMRLRDLLQEAGANVLLSRTGDYFVGLYERSHLANRWNVDLFVSIHSNAHPNPEVQGLEVYHYKGLEAAALLARKIETNMAQLVKIPSLGVKVNDFVVIRETLMPSVLVELGYLSNPREESIMSTAVFKDNAATGIFNGIIDYYLAQAGGQQTQG